MFPQVDPIPLPAPVELFKLLHDLTLALHFCALHLYIGGLLVALALNVLGHGFARAEWARASDAVVDWLPILMTYVINLGVPPLLFAQVLYGRAIYTSSVLIGFTWLAVIPLLMITYQMLYLSAYRAHREKPWWGYAAVALVGSMCIANIYSMNTSLMLRPDVWVEMYRTDPHGMSLPPRDPTVFPRFAYMMMASLAAGGALMAWVSRSSAAAPRAADYLRSAGPVVALAGVALSCAAGLWAWGAQPDAVRDALAANAIHTGSALAWAAGAGLAAAAALFALFGGDAGKRYGAAAISLGLFVQITGMVVVRDCVRDAALLRFGYDVWDRAVASNWSVVILFLALFVAGLGIAGWLLSVALRAKATPSEDYGT